MCECECVLMYVPVYAHMSVQVVKRGVELRAKYIVKMDDDMCFNPENFLRQVEKAHDPKYAVYANYIWDKMVRNKITNLDRLV